MDKNEVRQSQFTLSEVFLIEMKAFILIPFILSDMHNCVFNCLIEAIIVKHEFDPNIEFAEEEYENLQVQLT